MHWAAKYIGKQWDPIGDGIDSFNCWTFIQQVQLDQYQRKLPDIDINANSDLEVARTCLTEASKAQWLQVSEPMEGDIVLLCRTKQPVHIGTWIVLSERSGVLHCCRGAGSLFQTPLNLRSSGWGGLRYFRWVG